MLFNSVIDFLSGLKDLRDNGKDNVIIITIVGYLDLIGDNKMVVFYGVFK